MSLEAAECELTEGGGEQHLLLHAEWNAVQKEKEAKKRPEVLNGNVADREQECGVLLLVEIDSF